MIDFTEVQNGEEWELFARDFLTELGFFIESSPDRGSDAGKDILVSEELSGTLGRYRLRWLVSCKHNAVSGKSVNEEEERNIRERMESFNADGFIGFYSTVPSSGLNSRLRQLREGEKIKDFRIFDHKLIENHLIRVGYSVLLMRYFPQSYKVVKPLHLLTSEYIPLKCKVCQKDLLHALYEEEYQGVIAFVHPLGEEEEIAGPTVIEEIYWACKDDCDLKLQAKLDSQNKYSGWEDITDLSIPAFFMKFVLSTMNATRLGTDKFSDIAYEQLKLFILAMSQKVLRETTPKEKERVGDLISMEGF
jgi:hypothetical protein